MNNNINAIGGFPYVVAALSETQFKASAGNQTLLKYTPQSDELVLVVVGLSTTPLIDGSQWIGIQAGWTDRSGNEWYGGNGILLASIYGAYFTQTNAVVTELQLEAGTEVDITSNIAFGDAVDFTYLVNVAIVKIM